MFQQKNSNKPLLKYHRPQSVAANPYFLDRRSKGRFNFSDWNWAGFTDFLFYSSLMISFLFILYWLLFSSFFTIKNVQVLDLTDDYEVKSLAQDFLRERNWGFKESNLFLMDKNELKNRLLSFDSRLSDVLIRKVERDTISIELRYKEVAGYWQCENRLYAFENDGDLINDIKSDNGFFESVEIMDNKIVGTINMSGLGEYPIIKTWQPQCPASNKIPIQTEILAKILEIFNYLKYYDLLKPVNFSFRDDISRNLEVKTLHGFDIYFDLNLDILAQLKKFHVFYKFYLKDANKNSLEYIDLRIKEKIFYQ
jgi:hypothetical protein